VVLSGEGADEFFGGYAIYREPLDLAPISALPTPLQRGLRAVSRAIPEGVRGKSYLERGTTPLAARYYGNARIFTDADKRRLLRRYDPGVRHTDVTAPLYAEAAGLDPVTAMQYIDVYTWLRGDILVKADRMTMAHSLEGRVPFLDREVFEVAASIPVELKLPPRCVQTKYALRRALEGVVPPEIVNRPKLGFPTPIRVWLKDQMYEWARDILTTSGADRLIDLSHARALLEAHRRGEADRSREVWTVLIFCLWHAVFVEHNLDPGVAGTSAKRASRASGTSATLASRPSGTSSDLLTKPVVGSAVG
jgi:asparagine synthase (glutamine-hydrolysing)